MSSITWTNRDDAARALLAITRENPNSSISISALYILTAIPSLAIAPDLLRIVFDDSRKYWERRYAMRAYAALPGDLYTPELRTLFESELQAWARHVDGEESVSYVEPFYNMALEVLSVGTNHPSNRTWIIETLRESAPALLVAFVSGASYISDYESIVPILFREMRTIIDRNPELLNLNIATNLHSYGDPDDIRWLEKYLDPLVEQELNQRDELSLLFLFWSTFQDAVLQRDPTYPVPEPIGEHIEIDVTAFPVWKRYADRASRATSGDSDALDALLREATDTTRPVLLRAIATHFLGELLDDPLVTTTLCDLLRFDKASWERYPIVRYEAGEALCYSGTAAAWEAMVDAALHRGSNDLFFTEWISQLTAVLEGHYGPYDRLYRTLDRPWFLALSVDPFASEESAS